jgi:hypothetical protein
VGRAAGEAKRLGLGEMPPGNANTTAFSARPKARNFADDLGPLQDGG